MNTSQTKTFIDLFSGAGGMSCGLEMAGFECLLGVDFDKAAIQTFQANHPNAQTICGDLLEISTSEIRELIGDRKVDLICGGPPCQGFSTIGANDRNDKRNFLFREFLRVVDDLKPDYIIVENVTGLLSRNNENTLKAILGSFIDLGYAIDVRVLSAHHYGVPEKRRRTIFLGNRFGVKNLYPNLQFQDNEADLQFLPPARTVGWAFENWLEDNGECHNHDIEKAKISNPLERRRLRHIPEGKEIRYERDQTAYLPPELWFDVDWKTLREERFREAKLKRLDRDRCSNTINTSRTTYYHPTEDRYLTPREAAAIQSFPPHFIFHGTPTQQWRQIGNAVPPLLAKALGETILKLDFKLDDNLDQRKAVNSIQNIHEIRAKAFSYREKRLKDVIQKTPEEILRSKFSIVNNEEGWQGQQLTLPQCDHPCHLIEAIVFINEGVKDNYSLGHKLGYAGKEKSISRHGQFITKALYELGLITIKKEKNQKVEITGFTKQGRKIADTQDYKLQQRILIETMLNRYPLILKIIQKIQTNYGLIVYNKKVEKTVISDQFSEFITDTTSVETKTRRAHTLKKWIKFISDYSKIPLYTSPSEFQQEKETVFSVKQ